MNSWFFVFIDSAPPLHVVAYAIDALPVGSSFTTLPLSFCASSSPLVGGAEDAVAVVAGLLPQGRPFAGPQR